MSEQLDHSRLQRVVAVINGKGGVGKTSITANVWTVPGSVEGGHV